jgi:hypothetical protein
MRSACLDYAEKWRYQDVARAVTDIVSEVVRGGDAAER